ncbi:MAG: hypothetical protein WCJ53_13590 [Mycobacteriaceae bacterium]
MAEHPFAAVLAATVSAPLRVGVAGRSGAGRDTVRRALRGAGVVVADPGEPADMDVYVFVETLTREDTAALTAARPPAVAVLNKSDLISFRGAGPMVVANAQCRELERRTGVPTRPLAALLAVAASDPAVLDRSFVDALRAVTIDPARLTPAIRRRLLSELDLFGIATASAVLCGGADRAMLAALLRSVSGVQAVLDEIDRAAAAVRYRRLIGELVGLAERAVGPRGARVADFLASDAVVLARMAAAMDVMQAQDPPPGPADGGTDHLRRAIHWQHYARGPGSALHRGCGADIARGALRLWLREGGIPEPMT